LSDPNVWGPAQSPSQGLLTVGEFLFAGGLLYNLQRFTDEEIRLKVKEQENWLKSENITNPQDGFQATCRSIIDTLKKELLKRGANCHRQTTS
jgi:hypothetical protein